MRTPTRFRAETKYTESTDRKANINAPVMALVGNGGGIAGVPNRTNWYHIRLVADDNRLTQCRSLIPLGDDDIIYVAKAKDRKLSFYEFVAFIEDGAGGLVPPIQVHDHSTVLLGGTHWGGITQTWGGGSGANIITIPDAVARGLEVIDGTTGDEYLGFRTAAQKEVVINEDGADIDFRVEAVGVANALFVQGSDGAITLGGPSMTVPDDWWLGLGGAAGRLVWDSTAAPDTATFLDCNVGIGVAPTAAHHLLVGDATLDVTATWYGIYNYHVKTAGVTDEDDYLYGAYSHLIMNQGGGVLGHMYGAYFQAELDAGTLGTNVPANRTLFGMTGEAQMDGGTIYGEVVGGQFLVDLNAGTIGGLGNVYGFASIVDIEAGMTIAGNVYGHYIRVDDDIVGGVAGTVYMLYLWERTGVDYGIYQNGTADNYFGGPVGVGTITMPHGGVGVAKLAIEGTNASSAGPHVQFTTASDDYPLYVIRPWTHDNISLYFDAHYNAVAGKEQSSDAGSNYQIRKTSDLLYFRTDSGHAQGADLNWDFSIIMNTSGHWYPSSVKTQDLGTEANEWGVVHCSSVDTTCGRLVRSTRACPVCSTEMVRGAGTLVIGGEESDFALAHCLNCGNVAMEELNHLPPESKKRLPPKIVLENIRVKSSGHNRSVAIDFRYGEDVLNEEGNIIEQAVRNSTRLGEYEVDEFLTMDDEDRFNFLLALGRREWDSREETRLMQEEAKLLRAIVETKVNTWIGKDMLRRIN